MKYLFLIFLFIVAVVVSAAIMNHLMMREIAKGELEDQDRAFRDALIESRIHRGIYREL